MNKERKKEHEEKRMRFIRLLNEEKHVIISLMLIDAKNKIITKN